MSAARGKQSGSSGKGPKRSSVKGAGAAAKGKAKPSDSTPSAASSKHKVTKKKSAPIQLKQKKKRVYTEAELNIPQLNMITPAGVKKAKGQKKGKVFVEDQEQMMTILAMVNADKEGQIESKMMRARQLEEVRQARIRETEARAESKKQKLEDVKDELRKKKGPSKSKDSPAGQDSKQRLSSEDRPKKKRVSFG